MYAVPNEIIDYYKKIHSPISSSNQENGLQEILSEEKISIVPESNNNNDDDVDPAFAVFLQKMAKKLTEEKNTDEAVTDIITNERVEVSNTTENTEFNSFLGNLTEILKKEETTKRDAIIKNATLTFIEKLKCTAYSKSQDGEDKENSNAIEQIVVSEPLPEIIETVQSVANVTTTLDTEYKDTTNSQVAENVIRDTFENTLPDKNVVTPTVKNKYVDELKFVDKVHNKVKKTSSIKEIVAEQISEYLKKHQKQFPNYGFGSEAGGGDNEYFFNGGTMKGNLTVNGDLNVGGKYLSGGVEISLGGDTDKLVAGSSTFLLNPNGTFNVPGNTFSLQDTEVLNIESKDSILPAFTRVTLSPYGFFAYDGNSNSITFDSVENDIVLTSKNIHEWKFNSEGILQGPGNRLTVPQLCSLGKILSGNRDLADIFLTSETDSQTLSYNVTAFQLAISNGNVISLSSLNKNNEITFIASNSANWQNTYNTVSSLSSTWSYQGTDLKALSGNWQSTYTTVQSNSANWNLIPITDPLKFKFIADGVNKNYSVSGTNNSTNASYINVYVENVKQEPIVSYTLSADVIEFIDPPENGTTIVVITPNVKLYDVILNQYSVPYFSGVVNAEVLSVAGRKGNVVLGIDDITNLSSQLSASNNTSALFTLSSTMWNSAYTFVRQNSASVVRVIDLVSYGNNNQTTNIAVGTNALKVNTTGNYNTSLGYDTLRNNLVGTYNVGIGAFSLRSNTDGVHNISVGSYALQNNTVGGFNVSFGTNSLFSNVSGNGNVAIGSSSLYNNINAFGNIAIGRDALYNNTTGIENMGLGYRALFYNNADWNVAVGAYALFNTNTGQRNVGIGKDAAISNTSGEGIVAVGDRSAASVTNRSNITAIGRQALFQIIGTENTAVGAFSQCNYLSPDASSGTGSNNTSIGYSSLGYLKSGSNNVAVGHTTLLNNLTGSNNTAIGYQALYSTDYTNSTGLGYQADVTGSNQIQLGNSATNVTYYNSIQNRSDIRDKTDIRDTVLGLDFIKSLRPVDFKWDYRDDYKPVPPTQPASDATETEQEEYKIKLSNWLHACKLSNLQHDGSKKRNRYHHGLIAQEVGEALFAKNIDFGGLQYHAINGGDDVFSIGYAEFIAPLIKSIQELNVNLENALDKITKLENEINNLKK